MLIKLTSIGSKHELWLEHTIIWAVGKDPSNPLITMVNTTMMSQKGPVNFAVTEPPSEIAELIRSATMGTVPRLALNN